jgi:hypothetical protein
MGMMMVMMMMMMMGHSFPSIQSISIPISQADFHGVKLELRPPVCQIFAKCLVGT